MRDIAVNFAMTPSHGQVASNFGVKYAIVTSARPGPGIWQMIKPAPAVGFMYPNAYTARALAQVLFEDGWNVSGVIALDVSGPWGQMVHTFDCPAEPEPVNPDAPTPSADSGSW